MMHVYNDDFGCLANFLAWQIEEASEYLDAARRFLNRMVHSQRDDGGFGPEQCSVPSAGGTVLLELLAGIKLGYNWAGPDTIEKGMAYLRSLQVDDPSGPSDGAFRERDENGCCLEYMVMRTQAYAVLALLYGAGADSDCCFVVPK
jgi:hypothetical protein